tara:strand:- start:18070 stop:18315 length:246 start_codon:yes stop_codon:yes gene_type:complete
MSDEYSHDLDVTNDAMEEHAERQLKIKELIEYHMNIIKMIDLISLARDQMESAYNNIPIKDLDKEYSLLFNGDLLTNTEIH